MRIFCSKISGGLNNIESAVREIINCLMSRNCSIKENTIYEIRVILNELIINAYKHGNKEDFLKNITVRAGMIGREYALFIIEDEGEGYDYRHIINKLGSSQDDMLHYCSIKENGRGLMIVQCLCDKINFNSSGNKVTVLKRLS